MNSFTAEVAKIDSQGDFYVLYVNVKTGLLKLLKLELPRWIDIGDKVKCSFPEASISICKGDDDDRVSIENRIEAKVDTFRDGELLSEVQLSTQCGPMVSLITTDARKRMDIEAGNDVMLLLKAVDIKLDPILGQ